MDLLRELDIPYEIERMSSTQQQSYGNTYATWIQEIDGDLLFRTFGYKTDAKGKHYLMEVMRESPATPEIVIKNWYYSGMAGWRVVWKRNQRCSAYNYYWTKDDFDIWQTVKTAPGIFRKMYNTDAIIRCEKYKYSGWRSGINPLPYLQRYNEDHGVEFFGKLGFLPSKPVIAKCKKDRQFCRFLRDNAADVYLYGTQAALYAYKHHIGVEEARNICYRNLQLAREFSDWFYYDTDIKKALTSAEKRKVVKYLDDNHISGRNYRDYLVAAHYCGYDLHDTKTLFPKDFNRMHDLRIDEQESKRNEELRAEARERQRKQYRKLLELDIKFAKASDFCKDFTFCEGWYCLIIPESIAELQLEGNILHHCVGKMGYDVKMADMRSFIGFVRRVDDIETPLVTVEYDLQKKKVLQCYGDHDSKPTDEIQAFVKQWEQVVTQMLAKKAKVA